MISINYSKAYSEANRLRTVASECERLYNDSRRALSDINRYWEGEGCSRFLDINEQWRREIQSIEYELESISSTIKRVADDIRAAERRAIAAMKAKQQNK